MNVALARFEPKSPDGRPLWRLIYDHVVAQIDAGKLDVDGIVGHEELRPLIGILGRTSRYYDAVSSANRELRAQRHRSLRCERGVGYRLVTGAAQVELG